MWYVVLTALAYVLVWVLLAAMRPPDNPLDGEFDVEGCTEVGALNYNVWANVDDSSCIPGVPGCSRPWAYNFGGNMDIGTCYGPTASLKELFVFANAANVLVRDRGRYFILSNDRALQYARDAAQLSGSNVPGRKQLLVRAPGVSGEASMEFNTDSLLVANRSELFYPLVVCRSFGSLMHNGFELEEVSAVDAGFLTGISGSVVVSAALIPRFALETLARGRKYFFVENGRTLRLLATPAAERRFHALLHLRQLQDFYVNAYWNVINSQGEATGSNESFSLYSIEHVYYTNVQMYEYPAHVVMMFRIRDFRGEPVVLPPGYFTMEEEIESIRVPAGHAAVLFSRERHDQFIPTTFPERHVHRGSFVRTLVAGEEPIEIPRLFADVYAVHVLPVDYGITLFSGPARTGVAWNIPFGYFQLRETPFAAPFAPRSARIAAPNVLLRLFSDATMRREAFRYGALLQSVSHDIEIPADAFGDRPVLSVIVEQFQDNVMVINGMFRREVLDFGVNVVENSAVTAVQKIIENEVVESCRGPPANGPRGCFERLLLLNAADIDLVRLSSTARFVFTTNDDGFEADVEQAARTLREDAGIFNLLVEDAAGDIMVQSALFQRGKVQNKVSTRRVAFTLKHFDWVFSDVRDQYIGHITANWFNLVSKLYNSPPELERIVFDFTRVSLLSNTNEVLAIIRDQSHPVFAEFQKISTDFPIDFIEFRVQRKETVLWLKTNIEPFAIRARQASLR